MEFKRIHMTDRPMDWEDAEKRIAALERELGEAKRKADDWMNTYNIRFADYQKIKKQRDTYHLDRDRLERELKEKGDVLRYAEAIEQDHDRLQAKVERLTGAMEKIVKGGYHGASWVVQEALAAERTTEGRDGE